MTGRKQKGDRQELTEKVGDHRVATSREGKIMKRRGFTLIELLVVIAIM